MSSIVLWGGDLLNGRLGLRMAVWLQSKVRECGLVLRPKLKVSRVGDAQPPPRRHCGAV